jgi:adenylosuccinate lyase
LQNYQRLNNVLLDFNQDMWRYISDYWFTQEERKEEVGSSTMPQKINPIKFENSEGNLGLANTLIDFFTRKLPVSRLQRDLSDSTVMRNLGVILSHSLLSYKSTGDGLIRVWPHMEKITDDLNRDWSILTEGVQTILRRAGVEDPYALIKSLSRGKHIDKKEWQEWVKNLPIENSYKDAMMQLTPTKYTGRAAQLTSLAIQEIQTSRKK